MPRYRIPGAVLTEHTFTVPVDHARPGGDRIELFAREVVAPGRAGQDLPWLLFLQGGPGFGSPRPTGTDGWLSRALTSYRVLLLDQRGTGRSTPATRQTLARLASPVQQADYLSHFRADSIVADAELIRCQLTGGKPWSVLGQSFGGFCTVTYLAQAPEGVAEAFIAGGLPGLTATADDVYRLTYPLAAERSRAHYQRYPGDAGLARRVARRLARQPAVLPSGGELTVQAFQSIGRRLGFSTSSHELHYLLQDAFAGSELSDVFLHTVSQWLSFAPGPLYAVLHEASYAQGAATNWSAQRIAAEYPEFGAARAVDGDEDLLFTGEMIYPWMFEHDPVLRPLRAAAELLAEWEGWPPLYRPDRLAASDVPAVAAVYYHDMYVPRQLSLPAAAAIGGLQAWITSEYEHDGLRVSSGRVLGHLIDLAHGNL